MDGFAVRAIHPPPERGGFPRKALLKIERETPLPYVAWFDNDLPDLPQYTGITSNGTDKNKTQISARYSTRLGIIAGCQYFKV